MARPIRHSGGQGSKMSDGNSKAPKPTKRVSMKGHMKRQPDAAPKKMR